MLDKWPDKDPDELLDFDIDWAGTASDPGRAFGDALLTSLWEISTDTDDTFLIIGSTSFSAIATKIWLSGGTLNRQYKITNEVTTTGGRIMNKSGLLTIKEK